MLSQGMCGQVFYDSGKKQTRVHYLSQMCVRLQGMRSQIPYDGGGRPAVGVGQR